MHTRTGRAVIAALVTVIAALCFLYYEHYVPKESISYYYALIAAQESVAEGVTVTADDLKRLSACKQISGELANGRTQDCLKEFYVAYTLSNGVRKAFSHLALLEKESKDFIEDCHYISHGIGRAQLQVNRGDVGKSFAAMSEDAYFKNIATCGNGYFHGVIEEYAKYETDKNKLVDLLSNVCKDPQLKNSIDCFHGMGHAAFVQLEYKTKDALYVCDRVTTDPTKNYSCYMGVFMEMAQDLPTRDLVAVKDGIMTFTMCDSLPSKYRAACYGQDSAFFENFTSTPRDFKKNVQYCKQIANKQYRMACVKFFAGRAIRVMKYEDVAGMCKETSSVEERVMCTAVFAARISRSIDNAKNTPIYAQAVQDVCRTLPFYESSKCVALVLDPSNKIYFDPNASEMM